MAVLRLLTGFTLAAVTSPALAHTGLLPAGGFGAGFSHPIVGLDHVLAMVTVGLFAAMLGGVSLWAVPGSFVAMMLVGGALGIAGLALPAVEIAIVLSIIVLGGLVAFGRKWPIGAATALVGVFAIFHGHAHGAEIPDGADWLGYSAGFALATALLHLTGIGAGLLARGWPGLVRLGGAAATVAGLSIWLWTT